jgi:RNA polymerase sigma-70 factor (family 1)
MHIKSTESDEHLLARVAKGDEYAFKVIFDRYHRKIYAYALRILASPVQAEEVMQETLLKLWLQGSKLSAVNNLQNYLITISSNKAISILRRRKLELAARKAMDGVWTETHNDTIEQILLNDSKKVVQEALMLLPDNQRAVYELCHIDGLTYKQAAQQLGLSPLSVQTYMKKALKFMREYVSIHTDIIALLIIYRIL